MNATELIDLIHTTAREAMERGKQIWIDDNSEAAFAANVEEYVAWITEPRNAHELARVTHPENLYAGLLAGFTKIHWEK